MALKPSKYATMNTGIFYLLWGYLTQQALADLMESKAAGQEGSHSAEM